jgi:integrase
MSSPPALQLPRSGSRDWFLRDSQWDDAHWILVPTSAVFKDRPAAIHWDFGLPNGVRFTHPRHASLLESAKQHVAQFRVGSTLSRSGCASTSLVMYFQHLRTFIRWMIEERLARFADVDAAAIAEYARCVRRRRGRAGGTIGRQALRNHYYVLIGLYRHRLEVRDALQVHPFPGLNARSMTAGRTDESTPMRYTPDVVAIPLIQRAIDFIEGCTLPLLAAREKSLQAYIKARRSGASRRCARSAALATLRLIIIDTPQGRRQLDSHRSLSMLIDLLYGACFVVISYLVGPRVSEILQLKAGCVHPFDDPASDLAPKVATIIGTIYKAESYHGRRHQWIAPLPAVYAITVLEALSAPHRASGGTQDLWQRPSIRNFGINEWLPDSVLRLRISESKSANARVNRLARWLQVPSYRGRPWRFSSHQGRKTFARFVALRDRTALYALAQQLGHRDIRQTDQSYVGTDYQLNGEIDAAVLDESISAWEQMLSATTLAGRMGAEVLARRPRFRGARVKQEIRAYARMLTDSGLTLGVCEWGYCVYREEFSACHGTNTGPDPVLREPSTCARCKNFSVTDAHRPYWEDQADRYQLLLNDASLPTQTLKISRARLDEARSLLRSLDSSVKEMRRARTAHR